MDTKDIIEVNFIPLDLAVSEEKGFEIGDTPATNTGNTTPTTDNPTSVNTNIVPSGGGSIVKGFLKTQNFNAGVSGWSIDGDGNVEFNDGVFRGSITGATGTFTGVIAASAIDIGGDDATSFHVDSGGGIWSGASIANKATAPFRVSNAGVVVATDITATGTINAQAGYLSAGVYVDTVNGLVCESEGINVGTAGHIRGGQTAYNTGTGWWIGYDTSAYKLSIGNSSDISKLLLWDGTNLIVNGSIISLNSIYGNGEGGDATISGDTTLTGDKYYDNLTVNTGVTLNTGHYRVFVKGTLTLTGTAKIAMNGNAGGNGGNGSGGDGNYHAGGGAGTAGAALSAGFFAATVAGKVGDTGTNASKGAADNGRNGTNGDNQTYTVGAAGVAGGGGGGGGAGSGGAAGSDGSDTTGGTATATTTLPYNYVLALNMLDFTGANYAKMTTSGGSGSGGGGGSGAGGTGGTYSGSGGGGGGSASPGGICFVAARNIVGNGTIEAKGGNGGNGGNGGAGSPGGGGSGGGGGGGAGSGGVLIAIYSRKDSTVTFSVAGGTKGAKGTGGAAGSGGGTTAGRDGLVGTDGTSGTLIELKC